MSFAACLANTSNHATMYEAGSTLIAICAEAPKALFNASLGHRPRNLITSRTLQPQRLVEIFNQVIRVFQTDGEPQQTFG
jgi:hypothetical protein